jgi:hypothetical protein
MTTAHPEIRRGCCFYLSVRTQHLPGKIGKEFFIDRIFKAVLYAEFDAIYHPGHILSDVVHDHHTFLVLR